MPILLREYVGVHRRGYGG